MRGLAAPLVKLIVFAVVTILATATLAFSIANISGGGGEKYSAIFSDVASLNKGDEVRIAGVRVGDVKNIEIVNEREARVEFSVNGRDYLPSTVTANLRYRNLVGQRYIALEQGSGEQGGKLNPGGEIPLSQTKPAVNLTTLFDGFRPLFTTLNADDVNKLSYQIIQVFQGEAGTISDLVRSTASLTNTVADKDRVIGAVITNLNTVLETVNQHDKDLDSLIVNTQQLVSGLSADRDVVGSAVTSLAGLTDATSDLLEPTRPAIQGSIASLNTLATTLNNREEDLTKVIQTLPKKLDKLIRTAQQGSWFTFYLCGIDIQAGPGTSPNLNLPTGLPTVNQPLYTNAAERCKAGGIQG
ncbi:MCE family protein [Rhodococcus sp. BP-252]|uniref:ABC transporter substrate-binding protein n=1 Tax=Rhodococcoides kyotonense TaxID=398843 RepID=A0A177YA44_9NOCA|nr:MULTISPECIES: MCE family protein [Rhodococcus]MBY6413557.1 MCE family protein [Rhodococcus sp. BP-320]MBY6418247.1 MCE family protein [Rhodococcus sp. BP-321]MBY6422661.1 MCE family protein [Rhodococcus sp. BP-324]MBY6428192.1 MCE family protein [Rhodococcus sp. BP-323]MBY6433370.1 MCE family protein [Rhodococcus sp. BP-322]